MEEIKLNFFITEPFSHRLKTLKQLTAISRHADIESPVPSICLRPKSFVSGRDFSSLSETLYPTFKNHNVIDFIN